MSSGKSTKPSSLHLPFYKSGIIIIKYLVIKSFLSLRYYLWGKRHSPVGFYEIFLARMKFQRETSYRSRHFQKEQSSSSPAPACKLLLLLRQWLWHSPDPSQWGNPWTWTNRKLVLLPKKKKIVSPSFCFLNHCTLSRALEAWEEGRTWAPEARNERDQWTAGSPFLQQRAQLSCETPLWGLIKRIVFQLC